MKKYTDENYVNNIFQKLYPIGSIYMSTNNINPSQLFEFGTWEQIKDTFLLACGDTYAAGAIGGEATHTLTENEMPIHDHDFIQVVEEGTARALIPTWPESINPGDGQSDYWHINFTHQRNIGKDFYPYTSWAPSIDNAGNNQPHNNMPPYLAIYVWRRVS